MDFLFPSDITWNKSIFALDIDSKNEYYSASINSVLVEFSEKPSKPSKTLVSTEDYKKISEIKCKIPNCTYWEKWCKLTNTYDRVQIVSGCKNEKDYFKFIEILKFYNLNSEENYISVHVGASAISFANAIKKDNSYIVGNYEKVGSYNYIDKDLEQFKNTFEYKVHLFSGDITMDTSHDPINKEQLLFHLFFKQIITCLNIQEIGGNAVIKIFDTITRPTCQLICYLTNFYESVHLIKPRTSRLSNSEKFLVLKNFKGINVDELVELDLINENWKDELYCRNLGYEINDSIKQQLYDYNQEMINIQYNYIERIIKCSYNEDEIPEKQLSAFQNRKAIEFCNNFKCGKITPEEEQCKHLKKIITQIKGIKKCTFCCKCFQLIINKL